MQVFEWIIQLGLQVMKKKDRTTCFFILYEIKWFSCIKSHEMALKSFGVSRYNSCNKKIRVAPQRTF
ncbi:MAG: hypothetical protein EA394_02520 [Bacteroidia bacterium]|nr:MAG: hypothetical protein EA394_02520 [Bacteroidia bacterium]